MREISLWRRLCIHCAFAFVLLTCAYCWYTKADLFPFAPFSMYSDRYDVSYDDRRIFVLTKEGGALPLLSIGDFDEARINTLIDSLYDGQRSAPASYSAASTALRSIVADCLKITNCEVSTVTGTLPKASLCGLKAMSFFYRHLNHNSYGKPDTTKLMGIAECG